MQGTLETLYRLGFFPFLLAPLMAEPLDPAPTVTLFSQAYIFGCWVAHVFSGFVAFSSVWVGFCYYLGVAFARFGAIVFSLKILQVLKSGLTTPCKGRSKHATGSAFFHFCSRP
jgi:hypothetical protein